MCLSGLSILYDLFCADCNNDDDGDYNMSVQYENEGKARVDQAKMSESEEREG